MMPGARVFRPGTARKRIREVWSGSTLECIPTGPIMQRLSVSGLCGSLDMWNPEPGTRNLEPAHPGRGGGGTEIQYGVALCNLGRRNPARGRALVGGGRVRHRVEGTTIKFSILGPRWHTNLTKRAHIMHSMDCLTWQHWCLYLLTTAPAAAWA